MDKRASAPFPDRLEQIMKRRGITQSELAEAVDASQSAVSQWLSGRKAPSPEKLRVVARVLKVTPQWLEGQGVAPIPARDERTATPPTTALQWWWRPEPPDKARDYGNPNVWTFKPDIPTLVREALQNIVDAGRDQKFHAVFRIIRLAGEDLDEFLKVLGWGNELLPHLEASAKNEQKLGKLLRYGLEQLDQTAELCLLVIEDHGTIGLVGDEFGTGNFAALCRNNLYSEKQTGTASGSFGLGKAVLWRTSLFSTVLFHSDLSTPTPGGPQYGRLIGRADLAWHNVASKGYAGPGWYGRPVTLEGAETVVSGWGDTDLAYALHLGRYSGRPGTSVLVVGFHDPSSDEPKDPRQLALEIEEAVADNFWPILASGRLSVTIETAEGHDIKSTTPVDPSARRPEFVDALEKHANDDVTEKLNQEGDVVRRRIQLRIPRRKAPTDPHADVMHEAVLLVRRAPDQGASRINHVAFFRGREMIIKYTDLKQLYMGSAPFHAVVLAGTAAGDSGSNRAAEVFLRTAELPAHSEWTSTPDLKTDYVAGGKRSLERFFEDVKQAIREIVRSDAADTPEGPQSLKELLRIDDPPPPPPEPIRITRLRGEPDDQGRWIVEATIRVRLDEQDRRAWRIQPVLIFTAETGGGSIVRWEKLEGLKDCSADGNRLVIPPDKREARFRGVSDVGSHPVPTAYSSVTVELRHPERISGAES
jgi:transcriptional regulator with XRE-family HTH domain